MKSELFIMLFYFVCAIGISYLVTPYVIKLAHVVGAVDVPADDRRMHTKPMPRMGGLAIFLSFAVVFLTTTHMEFTKVIGLLVGSSIIIACGIKDDISPVSPKFKIVAQLAAAIILFASGFRIEFFTNFFGQFVNHLGIGDYIYISTIISLPVTIFWIVGITNTINLIDGLDGLAAGVSMIAASALTYVAFANGSYEVALLTAIITGSILGFLPYNFNPARIFMGDTGSLFLGFILSAVSIEGALKSTTVFTLFIPVIILGIPIFDTTFAIVRRIASGKSISEADKGHLHHRLIEIGLCHKRAVLSLYFLGILLGVTGILFVNNQMVFGSLSLLASVVLIFIPINKTSNEDEKELKG